MLIVGLTGSIGCGKSSFSQIMKEKNIPVIDADLKGRDVYNNKNVLDKLYSEFGDSIKGRDGKPNRKALAGIVFSDEQKLEKLNSITHPAIENMISDDIKMYKRSGKDIVIIDAALFIEAGYKKISDILIVVTCDEDIQIKRIINRDNCSMEDAIKRINSQMTQREKVKYADYVIDNSSTMEELERKAEEFLKWMGDGIV